MLLSYQCKVQFFVADALMLRIHKLTDNFYLYFNILVFSSYSSITSFKYDIVLIILACNLLNLMIIRFIIYKLYLAEIVHDTLSTIRFHHR